ncbi:sigma-70 family RNA polymerase sigma factor [Phycicoccus sp.]|uniref:RNA polymerase sigma factor n=1 Tax=Phycicoccus sp. TaxID=1902410 RepID=UPI002C649DB3|nr:sigma-70 family RNA polymerase sigma factor [Phycicoccus sp.]HMM95056.1 sigma-70 family RNA polymerase sigma factor [Phycicoccus sp.]
MDEAELIEAAREGQPHAGTFLVSMYAPRMLSYARSITHDLSDADRECICELAVERAVRKIDNFDPTRGTFQGWLRGFVRYTLLDWRRSTAARDVRPSDDLPLQAPPMLAEHPRPHPQTRQLNEAIADLGDADQLLVRLRYFEQLPSKEIAHLTGISDDAVRKRLSRITSRLRDAMST